MSNPQSQFSVVFIANLGTVNEVVYTNSNKRVSTLWLWIIRPMTMIYISNPWIQVPCPSIINKEIISISEADLTTTAQFR